MRIPRKPDRTFWRIRESCHHALTAIVVVVLALSGALLNAGPVGADPRCQNDDPWYGFCVGGAILQEYNEVGGWPFFGDATNWEADALRGGRWQPFTNNSSIYWHPLVSGGHANQIGGLIRDKWGSLGWEDGNLMYPTTRELGTPTKAGRYNHFEGGSIYYSAATGTHPIWGAIRDQWAAAGWENSSYGFPTTDEYNCNSESSSNGGRGQSFENGFLFWNTTPNFFTNSASSVYGSPRTLRYSSTTKYTSAQSAAVDAWNALGKVANVAATTIDNEVLVVRDVNDSDLGWAGLYTYRGLDFSTLEMNDATFVDSSDPRIARVMLHEWGHALGLGHSCSGAVMDTGIYFSEVNALTPLDVASFNTKHP